MAALTYLNRFVAQPEIDSAPYDYDLGPHSFPVSTSSSEAQLWFDRGYMWCIGFNHEEAVACFYRALEADPQMAMAYWGIAYASGPNYNKPWDAYDDHDLKETLTKCYRYINLARNQGEFASDMEKALIEALSTRCRPYEEADNLDAWTDDYADAMRLVRQRFPDSDEVAMLSAEAMMNRTDWALWDLKTGKVAEDADTDEIIALLEATMTAREARNEPPHPGLLHLYIHVMEMSPHPERALKACDLLRNLAPDCGHLQHMPTHIDVLCGHYQNAVDWNHAGIVADRKYMAREGSVNFYTYYRAHNYHFKAYAAMFLGQYKPAIEAAEELVETLPEELLRIDSPPMADWLEAFVPTNMHVMIRFGRWQEIKDYPLPRDPELFCYTTATIHYAKAVAYAASGDPDQAEVEAALFQKARAKVPEDRAFMNNTCRDILCVANEMMLGEIAYRKRDYEAAFDHLRRSVHMDDNLPYDEPWAWMQPTRHALGALLSEQGHYEEAASVYKADLGLDPTLSRACHNPDNVWSLHGLYECLVKLGRKDEARHVKQRLDLANARADRPIKASCFCKLTAFDK